MRNRLHSLGDNPNAVKQGGEARRPSVLVLFLGDLTYMARVRRQIDFLTRDYDVLVAAYTYPSTWPDVEFVELPGARPGRLRRWAELTARLACRLMGRYGAAYWLDARARRWRRLLRRVPQVDAIVVNELYALPLAFAVSGDRPVVFDAWEHWTSESASWSWTQRISMRRAHEWIVDRFVPRTAGIMTVAPGIADEYRRRAGVDPALVTNAPFYRALDPSPVTEPIRLLHVGVTDARRRLEDTIEAVRSLEGRFTLDLVLARDNEYRRRLQELAAADPRIRVLPPMPADEIVSFANAYDVGVQLIPPLYPNQVYSLPNKFFDYIQARLAVAIGPSQEMVRLVNEWDCGVVSPTFSAADFARTLSKLTVPEVERMKRNADRAAGVLTADNNRDVVLGLVGNAIQSRHSVAAS